jgi:predicted lipoprotein with Yx(FWY)xxD motif
MNKVPLALALLLSPLLSVAAQAQKPFDPALPYPEEVAVSNDVGKGYVYRRFPGNGRLYTYDLDRPGQSLCNKGCDGQRRPVRAPSGATKSIGDWSLVKRYDGTSQWAYRGKPVYTLYHDTPDGSGETATWHLLPYEK